MFTSVEQLYSYFLRNFELCCDNRVLYSGKLRLISMKDYIVYFSYADDKERIKSLDFPFPYKLNYIGDDIFELDYTLDTLCNCKVNQYNSLKMTLSTLNLDNKQKYFNKKIYLKFKKVNEPSELLSRELSTN